MALTRHCAIVHTLYFRIGARFYKLDGVRTQANIVGVLVYPYRRSGACRVWTVSGAQPVGAGPRKKPGARFRRRSSDTTRVRTLSLYSVSTSYRWIRSVLNSVEVSLIAKSCNNTVQPYKHLARVELKVSERTTDSSANCVIC